MLLRLLCIYNTMPTYIRSHNTFVCSEITGTGKANEVWTCLWHTIWFSSYPQVAFNIMLSVVEVCLLVVWSCMFDVLQVCESVWIPIMLLKNLPLLEVIVAVLSLFSEYYTVITLQLIYTVTFFSLVLIYMYSFYCYLQDFHILSYNTR